MAESREREREQDLARFVYVTRFGSHRCGSVLQLGGRRARGPWCPGLGAGRIEEAAREAAEGQPGGGELPSSSGAWTPSATAAAASRQRRASRAQSGPGPAARAGSTQKKVTEKFDFPLPWNEASEIMKKKKKKDLVWNRVYKVISRMLEENEKYRLRLNRQRLSNENSNGTR
ncbi:uncharacterized protein C5orf47 homolog isoform X2 [Tamandua tetradactyla]|uniref:uncharacterized protein C5orf47 homolog isoform X2 n=1 Tax=Tamandua tetradactyla TaxID=48850 RepID=UPI004053F8E6